VANEKKKLKRYLDPSERVAEILFGLIMVLSFTLSLSVATSGQEEVRTMLISAIGCNVAWGIVDAGFYLLGIMGSRGQGLLVLKRLRSAGREEGHGLISDALPPVVASVLRPEDLETMRQRLSALTDLPERPSLSRDDWIGAGAIFLFVFLSTFPVVVPFMVIRQPLLALRVSNAVALVMLFFCGFQLARHSGYRPWRLGLLMIGLGLFFVVLCIKLGG